MNAGAAQWNTPRGAWGVCGRPAAEAVRLIKADWTHSTTRSAADRRTTADIAEAARPDRSLAAKAQPSSTAVSTCAPSIDNDDVGPMPPIAPRASEPR